MNLTKFNKGKCNILQLDKGNPWYQYRLGDGGSESSPAEKELGVLVEEEAGHDLVMGAQQANCILGCMKTSMASR